MKRIALLITILCGLLHNSSATPLKQNQTNNILQNAINKVKNNGGIEAQFSVAVLNNSVETNSTQGVIQLKANQFKIVMPAITVWFNGKTQWTMQTGSDEVNVSNPTPEELRTINPYALIDVYQKDYTCTHKKTTYQGRTCNEVTLKAKNKERMQEIILNIDAKNHQVLSAKVKQNDQWIYFKIVGYKENMNWGNQHFTFSTKEYPNVEVIDLR